MSQSYSQLHRQLDLLGLNTYQTILESKFTYTTYQTSKIEKTTQEKIIISLINIFLIVIRGFAELLIKLLFFPFNNFTVI